MSFGEATCAPRRSCYNPCYAFMHPRAATRAGDLRAFFLRNLEWHRSLELTWVAVGPDDHPIGTVTLEPPGGVPGRLDQAIRHWVVPTWRDQGLETVRRLLSIDAEFKGEYRRLCHRKTYWHVHAVAVSPQEQGRGVGGAMLATRCASSTRSCGLARRPWC